MNGFEKVSYKTRVFTRDFENTEKTVPILRFKKTNTYLSGSSPVKFYEVGGELYVHCSDGTLKKRVNNAFVSTGFTSTVIPLVAPIIKGGVKTVIFISDSAASAGGENVAGVPYGSFATSFVGRLFIASGDTVNYSEEFDFTDFTVGLNFGGFLKVDKADGDVLYMSGDKGKLVIVCEHAIYTLTICDEEYEFKMEKVSSPALSVRKDTFCNIGTAIYFLSGNRLYSFSDGKIKTAGETLCRYDINSFGMAGGKDELYVLPVTCGNNTYLYAYDTLQKSEIFLQIAGYVVASGRAVKTSDRFMYDITTGLDTDVTATEYSSEYDFGSCRKKSICRLEAHIGGSADVVVTGEGFFRATLTEKCNEVTCFVHGRKFNIAFENASSDFKLYRLTVHYIVYGE